MKQSILDPGMCKREISLQKLEDLIHIIRDEYLDSRKKNKPFCSYHEAYAVLKEEVDELWETIKFKELGDESRKTTIFSEAKQVAAMALGIMYEFGDGEE